MNEDNPYADPEASGPEIGTIAVPPTTGKLAIASLVCGLVFCCPVTSLLAPVLGIAHFIAAAGKPWVRGAGLAIGGILLGLVFSAGWAFIAWSGYAVFRQAVEIPADVFADFESGDFEAAAARFLGDGVSAEDLASGWSAITDRFGTFESIRFDEAAEAPQSGNTIDLLFLATFKLGNESRDVPVLVRFMTLPGTLDLRIVDLEVGDSADGLLLMPPAGSDPDASTPDAEVGEGGET